MGRVSLCYCLMSKPEMKERPQPEDSVEQAQGTKEHTPGKQQNRDSSMME